MDALFYLQTAYSSTLLRISGTSLTVTYDLVRSGFGTTAENSQNPTTLRSLLFSTEQRRAFRFFLNTRAQLHTLSMRLSRSVLKKQKSHHSLTAILSNKSTLFFICRPRVSAHLCDFVASSYARSHTIQYAPLSNSLKNRKFVAGILSVTILWTIRSIIL